MKQSTNPTCSARALLSTQIRIWVQQALDRGQLATVSSRVGTGQVHHRGTDRQEQPVADVLAGELLFCCRRETVQWNNSPDHLLPAIKYQVTPPWPVYTAVDNLERAELTAFFDVKLWRDDRCTADIGPL